MYYMALLLLFTMLFRAPSHVLGVPTWFQPVILIFTRFDGWPHRFR